MDTAETVAAPAAAPETAASAGDMPAEPSGSSREAVERAMRLAAPETAAPDNAASAQAASTHVANASAAGAKDAGADAAIADNSAGQPPQRFSKAAQEMWAQTPPVIRTEVERAIGELTAGIEKYKTGAEAYESIRQFDDMARQSGTTLDQALTAYTGIEQALRTDPAQGFLAIAQNMGVDPVQLFQHIGTTLATKAARSGLPDFAQPHLAQPQWHGDARVAELSNRLDEFVFNVAQRDVLSQIDKFAADPAHPYFDELVPVMAQLVETRFATDLNDAYDKAVRLTPEVAAKIAAKAPSPVSPDPAQTRQKAAKSITGSPTPGSNPQARKPAGSTREALQSAFAQVGLGL